MLAEPAKIRARWKYTPPRSFADGGDCVTFDATPLEGNDKRREVSQKGAACYSAIRPDYNQYEVVCSPLKKARLSEAEFFESFQIFVEQGIISELIEARIEKGVPQMYSPGEGLTNQEIYAAFCWYRWCDSHPGLISRFLKLWNDKRYPWNIFQLLVYGITHHISNCNHSFISAKSYGRHEPWANPLLGIAAKIYFDPKDERKGKKKSKGSYLNTAIDEICASLSSTTKVRAEGTENWRGESSVSTFRVETIEDILSPRLIGLYEMEQPTKEELQAALKEIF